MFKQNKFFVALAVSFCFLFEQTGFAQAVSQPSMPAGYIDYVVKDKFRPLHLRSLEFGQSDSDVNILLDKGDDRKLSSREMREKTSQLLEYFQIGLALPNTSFWVNLRPDSDQEVIDPLLEQTELGNVLLAADLQLKKDVARFTDPETPLGREYWEKVYARAEALFGSQEMVIPTLTRPWIVPGEIIVRESKGSAYIYKATLQVMLEQDYIKDSNLYNFSDPRLKQLNEYSSELIRRMVIPRVTKLVNSSRSYAGLRQAYYSLILAQWYKHKVASGATMQPEYNLLIDSRDLSGLKSRSGWSRQSYYQAYKKSFSEGEYAKEEVLYTGSGPIIRQYVSGGVVIGQGAANVYASNALQAVPGEYMQASVTRDGGKLETVINLAKSGLDKARETNAQQPGSLLERIKSVDRSQLVNVAVSSLFIGITLLLGSPLLAVLPVIMTVYALYKSYKGEAISGKANAVFWVARVMVIGAVVGTGVGLIGAVGLSLGIAAVMSLSNRGINSDRRLYRALGIIGIVGSIVFAVLVGSGQIDLGGLFDAPGSADQSATAQPDQAGQAIHDAQAQPQAPAQLNVDTNGFGSVDLNIDVNNDGYADLNIDTNNDGWADINIDTDGDGVPGLNLDTNGDGIADERIDANGDGMVDADSPIKDAVNVDTNNDGKADINIDTNNDKYADINIDTDGDGKADLNIDTNNNGKPDLNIDTNGDRWEGINLDLDGNGVPDTNIDTNGDLKAEANIDSDGDGVADTKLDPDAKVVEPGTPGQDAQKQGGIAGQWIAVSLAAGTALGALSKFLNGKDGKTRLIGVSAAVGLSGLALAALLGSGLLISAAVFFGSFVLGYFLLSRLAARSAEKNSGKSPQGPDADQKALSEGKTPAQIEGADRTALPAPKLALPAFDQAAMMAMVESIAAGGASSGQQQDSLRQTFEDMQANGDLTEEGDFTDLRQYWDAGTGLSRGDAIIDYEDGKKVKIILSSAREEGTKIYYDYYNLTDGSFQTMVVNEVPGITYNVKKLRFSGSAAVSAVGAENILPGENGRFEEVVNQPHAVEVGDVIEHEGTLKRIVGKRNTGAFGIRYDLQDANDPNAPIEQDVALNQQTVKKLNADAQLSEVEQLRLENERLQEQVGMATDEAERGRIKENIKANIARIKELQADSEQQEAKAIGVQEEFADLVRDERVVVHYEGSEDIDGKTYVEELASVGLAPVRKFFHGFNEYYVSEMFQINGRPACVLYLVRSGANGEEEVFIRSVYRSHSAHLWKVNSRWAPLSNGPRWIGKGMGEGEETETLPFELQDMFEETLGDAGVEALSKEQEKAEAFYRIAPYEGYREKTDGDFEIAIDKTFVEEGRPYLNNGKPIFDFKLQDQQLIQDGQKALRFEEGFQPDFEKGIAGTYESTSDLYEGKVVSYIVKSVNGQVEYIFHVAKGGEKIWVGGVQATDEVVNSFGVPLVRIKIEGNGQYLLMPAMEYDAQQPGKEKSKISGYTDAMWWLNELPVVQEFRQKVLAEQSSEEEVANRPEQIKPETTDVINENKPGIAQRIWANNWGKGTLIAGGLIGGLLFVTSIASIGVGAALLIGLAGAVGVAMIAGTFYAFIRALSFAKSKLPGSTKQDAAEKAKGPSRLSRMTSWMRNHPYISVVSIGALWLSAGFIAAAAGVGALAVIGYVTSRSATVETQETDTEKPSVEQNGPEAGMQPVDQLADRLIGALRNNDQAEFEAVFKQLRGLSSRAEPYLEGIKNQLIERERQGIVTAGERFTIQDQLEHYQGVPDQAAPEKTGGIDFRALPIVSQPGFAPGMPQIDARAWQAALEQSRTLDTAKEWKRIQAAVKKGQVPDCAGLKSYVAACSSKENADTEMAKVLICVTQILRIEEDEVLPTSRELQELLVILDSEKPAQTVQKILQQADNQIKEPAVNS